MQDVGSPVVQQGAVQAPSSNHSMLLGAILAGLGVATGNPGLISAGTSVMVGGGGAGQAAGQATSQVLSPQAHTSGGQPDNPGQSQPPQQQQPQGQQQGTGQPAPPPQPQQQQQPIPGQGAPGVGVPSPAGGLGPVPQQIPQMNGQQQPSPFGSGLPSSLLQGLGQNGGGGLLQAILGGALGGLNNSGSVM